MKIRLSAYCLIAFMLSSGMFSCQKEGGRILSEKKMVHLLTDVYLNEAMLQQSDRKQKNDWAKGLKDIYFQDMTYRSILEKYRVNEKDFYASVDYYSRRFNKSVQLYTKVENNLNQLKEQIRQKEQQAQEAERLRLLEEKIRHFQVDTVLYRLWYDVAAYDTTLRFLNPAWTIVADTLIFASDTILSDTLRHSASGQDSLRFVQQNLDNRQTDYLSWYCSRHWSLGKNDSLCKAVFPLESLSLPTDAVCPNDSTTLSCPADSLALHKEDSLPVRTDKEQFQTKEPVSEKQPAAIKSKKILKQRPDRLSEIENTK